MNKKHVFFYLLFLHLPGFAVELVINQPGQYVLYDSITISPAGFDTAVVINTGNVILDLGGFRVQQGNATAFVTGITINGNFANVTITNGIISNFSLHGLVVAGSAIEISRIRFENMGGSAIRFASTIGAQITNCSFYTNGIALRNPTIFMNASNGLSFSDCIFGGTTIETVVGSPNALIEMTGCANCTFTDIQIDQLIFNQVANPQAQVFRIINSSSNRFERIAITDSQIFSSLSQTSCFLLDNADNNSFIDCQVYGVSSLLFTTIDTFRGFLITNGSTNNLLQNCQLIGNSFTSNNLANDGFIGFLAVNSDRNTYINCSATYNSVGSFVPNGGACYGFFFNPSSNNTLIGCVAVANTSANFATGGIVIIAPSVNNATIGCELNRNIGVNDGLSRGFFLSPNVLNLVTQNIGFNNGALPGNQFAGVSGGSWASPVNVDDINFAGATPWSNIAVPV